MARREAWLCRFDGEKSRPTARLFRGLPDPPDASFRNALVELRAWYS